MKRRIDLCHKCGKFCHDDNGMKCLASDDDMVRWLHFLSENLAIPKDFFFDGEVVATLSNKDDFNEKDVPDDCSMKTEYLVSEWNRRNENGHS